MEAPASPLQHKPFAFPKPPPYVAGPFRPLATEWQDIADAYEGAPGSLRAAWLYLGHHPAFWTLSERVGGFYVASGAGWYQSIETGVNEDNTVWLEIQPTRWPDDPEDLSGHKIEVESPMFELAVTHAALRVHENYGNDRVFLLQDFAGRWQG